jgi:hypothetical protein
MLIYHIFEFTHRYVDVFVSNSLNSKLLFPFIVLLLVVPDVDVVAVFISSTINAQFELVSESVPIAPSAPIP